MDVNHILECHCQLKRNEHQNAGFNSYFLFSEVFPDLFYHCQQFVLICCSCERLPHFLCASNRREAMCMDNMLKNQGICSF